MNEIEAAALEMCVASSAWLVHKLEKMGAPRSVVAHADQAVAIQWMRDNAK